MDYIPDPIVSMIFNFCHVNTLHQLPQVSHTMNRVVKIDDRYFTNALYGNGSEERLVLRCNHLKIQWDKYINVTHLHIANSVKLDIFDGFGLTSLVKVCFDDNVFITRYCAQLPMLKEVSFYKCNNLKSIAGLVNSNKLEYIDISGCYNLECAAVLQDLKSITCIDAYGIRHPLDDPPWNKVEMQLYPLLPTRC